MLILGGLGRLDGVGTIPMKNVAGKEWKISVLLDPTFQTERYYLVTGWSNFQRTNKLSEGDECIFKFITSERKLCLEKVTKEKGPAK